MIRKVSLAFALGFLALLSAPDAKAGQSCTDGVDCYCDCVRGPNRGDGFASAACATKRVGVDASVLLCEDFEARPLVEDVSTPEGGPWYDDTGQVGGRGHGSWWTRKYGTANAGCAWRQGEPASPTLGRTCTYGTCYTEEWSAGNPWQANALSCIDIMRSGEFDDERSANLAPVLPGGGAGVFDGTAVIAHRVGPERSAGDGDSGGFHGSTAFPRRMTTLGLTEALAYPSDVVTSRIFDQPWKDNEFTDGGNVISHWHRGMSGIGYLQGGSNLIPYVPFLFVTSQAACNSALAGASLQGQAYCGNTFFYFGPRESDYQQARDFPYGTWGCSQAYISGIGTSNMTLQIWHNGRRIFSLTGFDSARALVGNGFLDFKWNSYANQNSNGGGVAHTTYRYEDNVHIREGTPVSCEQIGFTSLTPPPPIPDPTPTEALGKPGAPVYVP